MYGLALRLSKALRAAPADAVVLLTRALERVGLRRVPAKPASRTGFLRGYSVPDDFDRMGAPEIEAMFEGRQREH